VYRVLLYLTVSLLLAVPAIAQEQPSEEAAAAEDAAMADTTAEAAPAEDDEELQFDETGLDEQGFTDEDDDFRPSEDIPADQSIPFPTDI